MDDSKLSELRLIHKDLATYLNNQHEVMSNSLGLPPWLTQTVKTRIAVRCKNLDRQDHCTAF